MYQPKVSVVTVCYNSERTIEQAILSVLNQSYHNIEYIIIDGGSTDATVDIIKKYEHRLAYWHSEPDDGIYDAMNKGIRKADGELLAFLNSDDYYFSNDSLQIMVGHFNKNRSADIIAGRIALINSYGIRYGYSNSADNLEEIAYRMIFDHPAMLVKRELFILDGLFDISYKIAADYEWSLREYGKGRNILPVSTVVTAFRTCGLSSELTYALAEEVYQIGLNSNLPELLHKYQSTMEEIYQAGRMLVETRTKSKEHVNIHYMEIQEQFHQLFAEQEVCIWGYGIRGQECHDLLEYFGYHVSLIIDVDQKKWQAAKLAEVRGPDRLQDYTGFVIISPLKDENVIKTQIEKMKLKNIQSVFYSDILNMLKRYIR